MKKILLVYSSGIAAILLLTKMDNSDEAIGEEEKIWAVGQDKAKQEMTDADVVLIGPQMSFLKKDLQKEAEKYGIQVNVVDIMTYRKADGKKRLNRLSA